MDFSVSAERQLLGNSLTRLLQDKCGFEARTRFAYEPPYHNPELWAALCELGLFYAFLPESKGGIGGSGFDVLAVFEPLGHALCPEPILAQLMSLRLLAHAGAELETALLGKTRLALATGETEAPWTISDTATRASASGDGWTVTGHKSVVYGGHAADTLLVPSQTDTGLSLFSVASEATRRKSYGMIDGGGAAEVLLEGTPATLICHDAKAALDDALDWGRLALCAEALGAMEAGFARLIDYLKTRQQFGKALSTFQALQHRTVDLKVELEQARSITIHAAGAMGTPGQAKAVAQMKALVGETAQLMAEESIQMQGGIAMTWEYPASHIAKRLTMIDHQLGDADFHIARLAKGACA